MEGLSLPIQKADGNRQISGVPITREGTKLSHLFFADDNLLFCKSNVEEWSRIHDLLVAYEKALGQKLNI